MRLRAPLLLALVVLGHAGPAPAQITAPGGGAPHRPPPVGAAPIGTRIDPSISSVLGFRAKTGRTAPGYLRSERLEREGVLPVVIRFEPPPTREKIEALARSGVEWERAGEPLLSGAFAAKIGAPQLAALVADPSVVRVACDLPREAPRPLAGSARETGIAAARRALRAKDGRLHDGSGVKIADVDSGLFVFHPAFFRADAGVFAWADVDGDGAFTPGVDGVDLDGDGAVGASEILRALIVDAPDRRAGLDPSLDYVYLDLDGNGRRDFGSSFGEATPAYGEPIFVLDDVDGDGKLARSEKLLRLGSSKVAAARSTRTFTRGHETFGIAAYGQTLLKDEQLLEYASHGTGASGILVAGIPDRSKLLGLAPGAELVAVGYGERDPSGTVASVQWAIDQGANVILTEYAPYTGYPLDGSTEEEALLDSAVDAGIVVVNPAGNLTTGYKHRSLRFEAGANVVPMKTDAAFLKGPYVALSLLHRGDPRVLAMRLDLPDGTAVDVPGESTGDFVEIGGDRWLNVVRRTSARGTHEVHVQLYAFRGSTTLSLPEGKWTLRVTADAAFDAELFAADAYNSWARGFVFEENTPTRTICHPATSDKGLAIGAYVLHGDAWGGPGVLAGYSSIGPRIDGDPGIDLAAPDDPWSTGVPGAGAVDVVRYEQFGGTSGAGPHVAAAAALLKQVDPTRSALAIRALLVDSAKRDAFVTTDATKWGAGKLDVAGALGVGRNEGAPPKVTLVAPSIVELGAPIELRLDVQDDRDGARARWDLDYDGTPDTDWEPIGPKTLTGDALGVKTIRVDVLDADGHLRGATARVEVAAELPDPGPTAPAGAPADDGGCGCRTSRPRSASAGLAFAALFGAGWMRRRRPR